ncbi:adenine phosphoribosyltransferase [Paenarthrobacter sp. DKR-5]|uniref:adenine phosphoribosyltransferase n=1 Tax=Paenarthrobacter sp. DKR-5 TaxID=2835535 RepID=UPI001BDC82AF|nr:adenine phosphoribosyltransferase [Paenarthrobacter sp. DKR-5]MBT1002778.1 adenine phosphoribosyltransferase [Paenarthrobacter sp. DKR-5]
MNESVPAATRRSESVEVLINRLCATVPNYPKPGIVFKDLTPVFADGTALKAVVHALIEPFAGQFDAVAGVEARGFLLAAAAAYAAGVGVVTVRKAGKLPREVFTEHYDLEYGSAALELHKHDVPAGQRVLILDDVLATGGTLSAASRLFEHAGIHVAGFGVVLELGELRGRAALSGHRVRSLVRL